MRELEKVVDWLVLILYSYKLLGGVFSSPDWHATGNPETYNRQKFTEVISYVQSKIILKILFEELLQNGVMFLFL